MRDSFVFPAKTNPKSGGMVSWIRMCSNWLLLESAVWLLRGREGLGGRACGEITAQVVGVGACGACI